MIDFLPTEKEMINNLIDKYTDLQRIKKSTVLGCTFPVWVCTLRI